MYNVVHMRKMTRNDFKDLKQYLMNNVMYYRNIFEVAGYVIDHLMSGDESTQMFRSFERVHPMHLNDVKYLYILTHFLKMTDINLCELITFNHHDF